MNSMARENDLNQKESVNPEEFYESYEDLFEDDDLNSGPCYLPEKDNNNNSKKGSDNAAAADDDVIEQGVSEIRGLVISAEKNGDCNPRIPSDENEISLNEGRSALRIGEGSEDIVIKGEENEILEIGNGGSPSSSGYEGGTGSSSSSASNFSCAIGDGIVEQFGKRGNGAEWVAGKRHANEDDMSIKWRKRKKHFFIISHAGKPIYSRYGDENKLAGFSATLQAIISYVENSGDNVRLVQAGNHQIVFIMKGPIYLVCISCTEEPFQALKMQLELLYGQMLLILTKSIEKYFGKNAKFDMRPLLGGTDVVFSSLIHSFSWNPATFLHAYTCVPLSCATRQAASGILQDIVDSRVIFAILMCRHKVISISGAEKATLHPDDILLLSNFIVSSESFRTSEAFSPICVPRYNSMAFLYAYVHYLKDNTVLVLLTTDHNGFYHLKDCRIRIETVLNKSNVLNEVKTSMLNAGLHVEDLPNDPIAHSPYGRQGHDKEQKLGVAARETKKDIAGVGGPAGLWHFMYKSIYLDQYVASEFSPPLNSHQAQKSLLRAYQNLYSSMHIEAPGPHKMQYRRDRNYILLCWITQDFELYAAFDPLAEKSMAVATSNRVCQWIRDLENEIFFLGATPFSW